MNIRPRLTLSAAALLLASGAAGCTDATDNAVGTIQYITPGGHRLQLEDPSHDGCHRLPGGAEEVSNNTTADLWLYFSPDCQGRKNTQRIYVGTTLTNNPAQLQPWRSFSVVG
ncbi:hypothetical protein ACZ90_17725 [Streptomyces albus subsp. albus]|nr:hypothetical protein ACZ90_17725 [Streptomyces albus subsp. albus]